jgi:hypothetical protein
MKRRQEAAEEAERQRLQAEQEAKAAAEAEAEAARQAELAASRDSADAPGSPRSEQEAGKFYKYRHRIIPIIPMKFPLPISNPHKFSESLFYWK